MTHNEERISNWFMQYEAFRQEVLDTAKSLGMDGWQIDPIDEKLAARISEFRHLEFLEFMPLLQVKVGRRVYQTTLNQWNGIKSKGGEIKKQYLRGVVLNLNPKLKYILLE